MDIDSNTANSTAHDEWSNAGLLAALAPVAFANPHAAARTLLRWLLLW